ncbi:galactoside alpha-(1,2)-fucosyltransferase 1-like isoform X2 [Paramacrobiotus metropolitanus]|uniref:galactoside alpha-(1,2)-fucosyltransferase 1-like isoform X2 n=1 Tax=Paramacrobiotus metropolitanus TaxID=2943436 RepID=UPI002445EA04|nr:galactoside alpha-(1,2)-fucosyltransferase 1-like isoform X2 [Paramacrobiotus metropolitanus]
MPAFLRATTADSMQKGLGRVLYAKGFRKVMGWLVAILLILYFATFISWEAVYRVIRLREWNINRWKCLDFAEGMPAAADYSLVHSSTEGFYISHNFHPGIGLGNKLFIYASLWGIAARNDLRLAISRNTLHDIMHVSTSVVGQFDLSDCKNLVFGMEECCFYDSRSENLFSQTTIRNVSVWGYLQSWKYFHPHYREAIRHQFRFKQDVLDRADAVRTRILNEMSEKLASHENRSRPVVGVHIRRGDVLTSYHLKVGHVEIPAVFYENANRYLFEKGPII